MSNHCKNQFGFNQTVFIETQYQTYAKEPLARVVLLVLKNKIKSKKTLYHA